MELQAIVLVSIEWRVSSTPFIQVTWSDPVPDPFVMVSVLVILAVWLCVRRGIMYPL